MEFDLAKKCDIHTQRPDCPDAMIALVKGRYGLWSMMAADRLSK